MTDRVHDLSMVISERRERAPDNPVVTLTARVSLGAAGDIRLLVRPVVAFLADGSGRTLRAEMHLEGGSSVVIEGPPLAALLADSLRFLRAHAARGDGCEHDHVFGLTVSFDVAAGPFVTLEQPPFLVASARTFVHEAGASTVRLLGEIRPPVRAPHHAPVAEGEPPREAFDLQLQARELAWLVQFLERAVAELAGKSADVDVKPADEG